MTWQIPWVISGVPEIPLDVTRVLAYAATSGQDGVIEGEDCKVTQVGGGASSVQVSGGAFVTLSRFAGALNASQSYVGYNAGAEVISMPANNTAGIRYDLVYAHVTDPGKEGGGVSPGPVETRVIQGVSSTVKRVQDVPGYTNVTGLALARVARPANSTTVLDANITDVRELAQPKTQRVVRIVSLSTASVDTVSTAAYTTFPSAAAQTIEVPSWANRVTMVIHFTGLRVVGASAAGFGGNLRVRMSSGVTQRVSTLTYVNHTLNSGDTLDTISALSATDVDIPAALRGTSAGFYTEALRSSGTATLQATQGTTVVFDLTFYRAVA